MHRKRYKQRIFLAQLNFYCSMNFAMTVNILQFCGNIIAFVGSEVFAF